MTLASALYTAFHFPGFEFRIEGVITLTFVIDIAGT